MQQQNWHCGHYWQMDSSNSHWIVNHKMRMRLVCNAKILRVTCLTTNLFPLCFSRLDHHWTWVLQQWKSNHCQLGDFAYQVSVPWISLRLHGRNRSQSSINQICHDTESIHLSETRLSQLSTKSGISPWSGLGSFCGPFPVGVRWRRGTATGGRRNVRIPRN